MRLKRVRKERLLSFWQTVIRETGIVIHGGVRVERITPHPWGFEVATSAGVCCTQAVLLATGRRGSPRRLGVPGETLPKVVYSLDDPGQYRGQNVLIVGGGDSALEAATELARHPVGSVTLSYRGEKFGRTKPANRGKFDAAVRAGKIRVLVNSHVRKVEYDHVIVEQNGQHYALPNEAVIICAGGLLPSSLLADVGVRVETKYGSA
jgi:thioredoxin reductase (NADPH)